ncbi:MAG: RdgB/HAM1 family non-canonical purine NTP pyrophosphatase [Myxococcales bacterium]|nr:RdgB/HAM1 family non-canonical purine NTP pyrophosphatase [Myxococcales bacterium]
MKIVLATQNRGKLRELSVLLDDPSLELVTLDDVGLGGLEVEETGDTFEANARLKAEAVAQRAGLPALADDSGLEVDALGGRPGVLSKRYAGHDATDADNNARLLAELAQTALDARTARFRCVMALAVPQGGAARTVLVADGSCEGHIAPAARGDGGFGYDPLFVPSGWGQRTLGEASPAEKNELSHRAEAVRALRPQLRAWRIQMDADG